MSPSSALETIRSVASSTKSALDRSSENISNSASPTKVHWEEKVEHSNELMGHASVDPQVLFGVSSAIQIASNGDDVAMEEGDANQSNDRIPPPITTAASASHYSFDSL